MGDVVLWIKKTCFLFGDIMNINTIELINKGLRCLNKNQGE